MIEITINLDHNRKEPLYVQLYNFLKQEIQNGQLKSGVKLPSKRKLSVHLGISQNTIETSYQQLCAEGYVESKPRRGFFVNDINKELLPVVHPVQQQQDTSVVCTKHHYRIDFSHGKIDLNAFPYSTWKKLSVQSLNSEWLFTNGHRQGELALREEIAKYLYQSRGVRCSADQIIIGAGTQYLITFLTLLIGRDSIFSMEDPGYHRAREAFKDQGVRLKTIPLDEVGISIKHLKESKVNVTYVTPSHQFPNGMVMPITRRLELLNWAEENGGYIIEDDYDSEFRYKGKPIPSLQGLDLKETVIYLGTFSKSFIPSLRINYIVLPKPLLKKYQNQFTVYKQTVSRFHQDTLMQFMKNGHWEQHLNKMRNIYRKKQKQLVTSIEKYIGKKGTIIGEEAGLHILLSIQNGMSEKQLIDSAKEKLVKVYPTSVYFNNDCSNQEPKILLGFGGLTEVEIEQGILLLREAWL